MGAFVVVPHVDVLDRTRAASAGAVAAPLGIDGFELLNPYHGTDANVAALLRLTRTAEASYRNGRPSCWSPSSGRSTPAIRRSLLPGV